MKKGRNSGVKGCKCQRSACLKNYCRCYNGGGTCKDTCKCIGCKNITPGTRNVRPPTKAAVAENQENHFSQEIPCAITRILMCKAFHLQSNGVPSATIEKEILLEFNRCLTELARHQQTLSEM